MGNKPTDASGQSPPVKKKVEAPKRPEEVLHHREATAQEGAGAKLQKAAEAPIAASKQLPGWQELVTGLNKARTDLTLNAAGYKPDDIVKKLSPKTVSELARGKELSDQLKTHPNLKLTPEQKAVVGEYKQYRDKIISDGLSSNVISALAIDHNTLISELNDSIAKRYRAENPAAPREVPGINSDSGRFAPRLPEESNRQEVSPAQAGSRAALSSAHSDKADAKLPSADQRPARSEARTGEQSASGNHTSGERASTTASSAGDRAHARILPAPDSPGGRAANTSSSGSAAKAEQTHDSMPPRRSASLTGNSTATSDKSAYAIYRASTGADDAATTGRMQTPRQQTPRFIENGESEKLSPGRQSYKSGAGGVSERKAPGEPERTGLDQRAAGDKSQPGFPNTAANNRSTERGVERSSNREPGRGPYKSGSASGEAALFNRRPGLDGQPASGSDRLERKSGNSNRAPESNRELQVPKRESAKIDGASLFTSRTFSTADNSRRFTPSQLSDAAATRGSRLSDQPSAVRPGVQRIESTRELIQTLKSGAQYMVRPLTLNGGAARDEKITLAVRSSFVQAAPHNGRAAGKDGSVSQAAAKSLENNSKITPASKSSTGDRTRQASVKGSTSQKPLRFEPSGYRGNASDSAGSSKNVFSSTTFRVTPEPKRHVLGTEIALTLILASAGIQRLRADQTRSAKQDGGGAQKEPARSIRADEMIARTARENVAQRLSGLKLSTRVESVNQAQHRPPVAGRLDQHQDRIIRASGWSDGRQGARIGFRIDGHREPLKIQPSLTSRNEKSPLDARNTKLINALAASEKRHTFGTEIALAALLASGGISRLRGRESNLKPDAGLSSARRDDTNSAGAKIKGDQHVTRESQTAASGKKAAVYQSWSFQHVADRESFLSRLKDQIKMPANLLQHYELLMRKISDSPVPIYVSGNDETVGVWSQPVLPELDLPGADLPESNPWQKFPKGLGEKFLRAIGGSNAGGEFDEEEDPRSARSSFVLPRPTVLIALEDTLVAIAETFFHDPNLAWLIADLNRGTTRQSTIEGKRVVELQTRQKILLPVWDPDITEFHSQCAYTDKSLDTLVTIVEETQIDRELMSSILGPVVGEKKQNDTNAHVKIDDFQLGNEDRKAVADNA